MVHAGCRALVVPDEIQDVRLPVHVLYPTTAEARPVSFGPYTLDVAMDARVAGTDLPVVALSHGNGGTPWSLRGLACFLAREGFAVVLVEHLGNSRSDNSLGDSPATLANRPRHIRLALSATFAAFAGAVRDRAALAGVSFGGYTALAVAGGRPIALPHQTASGAAEPVAVEPDPRVHAAVLLAPALPWLMAPGAVADVRIPLLVRTGERDELAPASFVEAVLAGLPRETPVDYRVVQGAGHFAFLSPFPPSLALPGFAPAHDPPGFDRAAYQPVLHHEILAFLRAR